MSGQLFCHMESWWSPQDQSTNCSSTVLTLRGSFFMTGTLKICFWLCVFAFGAEGERESKFLSLFSFVTFPNDPCTGSTGDLGTCLSRAECARDGGASSGNCASGFGTCCIFIVNTCGATVTRNCTYVQNPNFPAAFTTDQTCNFAVRQVADNICSVRLDMDNFNIAGPDVGNSADCSSDSFQAVASIGETVPLICGANTGQHMYLNAGFSDNSDLALNFNLMGGSSRTWRIKVSQIPCGTLYTPEPNCLMYLTGLSGQVRSYNFVATTQQNHLNNQDFEVCVRQEEGYCQVAWSPSDDENSFRITGAGSLVKGRAGIGVCGVDFLLIPNGHNGDNNCLGRDQSVPTVEIPSLFVDRYCGAKLNCIDRATESSEIFSDRFTIGFRTDGTETDPATRMNRGFSLNWRQIPC